MARQRNNSENELATAPTATASTVTRGNYFSSGNWVPGLLIAIVVLLVFLAGIAVAGHHRDGELRPADMLKGSGGDLGLRHGGLRGGMLGGNITNGQTRLHGVVTSVNGNGFTLAGNGSVTNVTTNSSTQYRGGNQVKQYDTVIAFGTDSSGTLTATQVVINP